MKKGARILDHSIDSDRLAFTRRITRERAKVIDDLARPLYLLLNVPEVRKELFTVRYTAHQRLDSIAGQEQNIVQRIIDLMRNSHCQFCNACQLRGLNDLLLLLVQLLP